MNNKIKKTIFTLKLQGIYIREVIKIIKERYGYDNKEYIEKIYKECKKRNDYYHKGSNIPKDLYESFLRIATKCYSLIFFHPDFTVGTGISPVQPCGSWTLPPVWNYTIP